MTPERVAELIGLSEGDLMPRITGKGKTLAITLPRMGKDKWARIKAKADKAGFEEGFSAEYGDGTIQPGLRMKEVATETKLPESMTQEERAASVTPEQYIEMALRQAQIGNDETGSLAERDRATVQGNAEEMHANLLSDMAKLRKPLNAKSVETYFDVVDGVAKIPVPFSRDPDIIYTREGDRYVFNPLSAAAPVAANPSPPAPKAVTAPSKGGDTSLPKAPKPTHTAIYDGKEISSDNFKQGWRAWLRPDSRRHIV
jgi:hypothetical protein